MSTNLFFSFDGIDGTGKSTQLDLFCPWLIESGYDVVRCRDPGTTEVGEALRRLVLHGEMAIESRTEVLIYMASRAQLVTEIIRPALQTGKMVVSDRYLLASVAYQAYGLTLDPKEVWDLGRFATSEIYPAMTFLLDLPVEQAAERRGIGRGYDRLEERHRAYHERVRAGFLREAALQPDRIVVIDATGTIDEVQTEVRRNAAVWLETLDR